MDDPLQNAWAKPVAPAWQPLMWFGAEVMPVAVLIMVSFVVVAVVPSFYVKIGMIAGAGLCLGLLRFLGQLDDHYFASTMGFVDRGEYIASATVEEHDRESGGKWLGLF